MASYSLGKRCRALAALPAGYHNANGLKNIDDGSGSGDVDDAYGSEDDEQAAHSFLVGTTMLSSSLVNEIYELKYSEEDRALKLTAQTAFLPGEIWDFAPHPNQPEVTLVTWSSASEGFGLSLIGSGEPMRLDQAKGARAVSLEHKQGEQFATLHADGTCKLWTMNSGGQPCVVATSGSTSTSSSGGGMRDVCMDPHSNGNIIACSGQDGARLYDVREKMLHECVKIETKTRCTTLDANPNRPHTYLTGGEDGLLSFWDTRMAGGSNSNSTQSSLMQFKKNLHEHWITRARYNPFHDQLVASASSDGNVCLWRAVSVSSTPLVSFEEENDSAALLYQQRANANNADVLVKTLGDNQDSVYGLAWSAINAWTFASLSYDGKVKVHSVPSSEKYKILL